MGLIVRYLPAQMVKVPRMASNIHVVRWDETHNDGCDTADQSQNNHGPNA